VGGRIIMQQKNLKSRTQLDEPAECTSGGDPLLFYKILHLLFFSSGTDSLCTMLKKMVLMMDFWKFSFFVQEDVSPTHSELCHLVSGSLAKHQVSYPIIILLKKFLSASAITIMSWQDVT
jgi:hypothetical protein